MADDRVVPPRFYKFRSLGGDFGFTNAIAIMLRDEIWYADPEALNDPFDCKPIHSFEGTTEERRAYFKSMLAVQAAHMPPEWRAEQLEMLVDKPVDELQTAIGLAVAQTMKTAGVCSLSGGCQNILLWSHYADQHRGISFVFSAPGRAPMGFFAVPVRYNAARPVIRHLSRTNATLLMDMLLTKALLWEYEDEWRHIGRQGPGFYKFPPDILLGVILGSRISAAHEAAVLDLARARSRPLAVIKARERSDTFSLSFSLHAQSDAAAGTVDRVLLGTEGL